MITFDLALADPILRARVTIRGKGQCRLTLDYPDTREYHEAVRKALADLIRPPADAAPLPEEKVEHSPTSG